LAEEIQSQSDTKALLPQIQTNVNEICDRIFLSFYRIPHSMWFANGRSPRGIAAIAVSRTRAFPNPSDSKGKICSADIGDEGRGDSEGEFIG
jgi:hypothetical protein